MRKDKDCIDRSKNKHCIVTHIYRGLVLMVMGSWRLLPTLQNYGECCQLAGSWCTPLASSPHRIIANIMRKRFDPVTILGPSRGRSDQSGEQKLKPRRWGRSTSWDLAWYAGRHHQRGVPRVRRTVDASGGTRTRPSRIRSPVWRQGIMYHALETVRKHRVKRLLIFCVKIYAGWDASEIDWYSSETNVVSKDRVDEGDQYALLQDVRFSENR